MLEAISAVLAFGAGVGASPIPIIAVILMLLSRRADVNGPVFLLGWMLGLSLVATGMYLLAGTPALHDEGAGADGVAWLRVGLGVLLLVGAARKWSKRPASGEEPSLPAWMAGVDEAGPGRAFGLALVLSANPKNLALAAGAAASLATVDVGGAHAAVALAAFVVVGSALVIASVVAAAAGGEGAQVRLREARVWLTTHNAAVMSILFLVFGVVLVVQGVGT